jgi:FKBP-type peptidyl-prolyl cis-trans isomerase 2
LNKKWQSVALLLMLLSTVLIVSCSGAAKPKDGDTVKVAYTLTLEDGTVYDKSADGEPFEFTLGNKEVITGFEEAVKGMKVGETKTVTLPPDKAYGQINNNLIQVVNRSQLPTDMVPTVGQYITGQSSADGTTRTFLITAVTDTTVTIDGNSPLAGKTLTFKITLVEIVDKE